MRTLLAVCLLGLLAAPGAVASHSFPADVPDDHQFHDEIGIFKDTNITVGCSATAFCPGNAVLRQAMAAYIVRALGLVPRPGESTLAGVPGSRAAILDDDVSLVRSTGCFICVTALELSNDGSRVLRLEGDAESPNLIGGHLTNDVTNGAKGATIAGGGRLDDANTATDSYSVVGGGAGNRAGNGAGTTADRPYGTVAGGHNNTASGDGSTVAGGEDNTASGIAATVGGGHDNIASGHYSFASGSNAVADDIGAFVWADGTGSAQLFSPGAHSFTARASGGVSFYSTAGTSTGVFLAPGSGSWSSVSDRAQKRDLRPVNGRGVLRGVVALPISSWSYRGQPRTVRHMGPTAQDFRRAFGLGEDARHITTIDADGVALAAIQALHRANQALERRNQALEARVAALERKERK